MVVGAQVSELGPSDPAEWGRGEEWAWSGSPSEAAPTPLGRKFSLLGPLAPQVRSRAPAHPPTPRKGGFPPS